jgi:hypothetical protein
MRCLELQSVRLPASLKNIEEYAFAECEALTEMSLPSALEHLENHAFGDCTALETVILPNKRLSVGYAAYAGCDALKTIVVPDSVRLFRYRLDRWQIPTQARIILHKELELSMLFAEMADPETKADRREELDRQIRIELAKLGRHRKTSKQKKVRTKPKATAKKK